MNLKLMSKIAYSGIDVVNRSIGLQWHQRKLMLQKILFVFCASELLNFNRNFMNDYLIITCHSPQTQTMSLIQYWYGMSLMERPIHDIMSQTGHF